MGITFVATVEPSEGGAINRCEIDDLDITANRFYIETNPTDKVVILFQDGNPEVVGRNGVYMEELLEACAARLEAFQRGPYPHPRNDAAIALIREAIMELETRTEEVR